MTSYDHLYAGALLVLTVVLALGKSPAEADAAARQAFYRQAWVTGAGMAAITLLMWWLAGRPLQSFGLGSWVGDKPLLTVLLAAAWALLLGCLVRLISTGAARSTLLPIYSKLGWLMPVSRRDLGESWGAGASAGAAEELAYRGFLLWYVVQIAGTTVGLLVTTAAFAIAHGYQRMFGMIFAFVAGLALALAYLGSGSMLLAMWMHATYNIASFTVGRIILRSDSAPHTVKV